MLRRSLALLVTVLALAGMAHGDDRPKKAEKDKLAPEWTLNEKTWVNTADGKALKIDDLKGKVVLIDFWGVW